MTLLAHGAIWDSDLHEHSDITYPAHTGGPVDMHVHRDVYFAVYASLQNRVAAHTDPVTFHQQLVKGGLRV